MKNLFKYILYTTKEVYSILKSVYLHKFKKQTMKTIYYNLLMLLLFSATITMSAQEHETTIPIQENIVPKTIINHLNLEFPNYKVTQYAGIPSKTSDTKLNKESEGGVEDKFEAIVVNLNGDNDKIVATYSLEGTLKTVFNNKSNNNIPPDVTYKVNKAYPGWTIINHYRHLFGDTLTDYAVIKKGDETITLFTNEFGDFVKV